ncbi:MarC family protein [Halosquirtibacter xylanolyticus]|uniref:MarC family protein n=1 Tax=Halosquirtibacter xylanolyticus TaxID=3374599 RepID=UPI0037490F87|nr:MarC family protein [Prolixibacteraceae bacterium]
MIHELVTFGISVLTGFFAIMNPIANTPIFMGITDGLGDIDKKRAARKSTFIAFIITSCFVLTGHFIFKIFGITIPAFKITGGILLFYVGFEMLESKKSKVHHSMTEDDVSSVAVSPLAIPILAGPGTLVTGINFVSDGNMLHMPIVIIGFGVMCFISYLCFSGANKIVAYLGSNMIAVLGKIMGLILAVMGVGMVVEGVKLAFLK